MKRPRLLPIAVGAALLLPGCGRADDAPGAISADDAQQLNDAAAMLDANSVDANLIDTNESMGPR